MSMIRARIRRLAPWVLAAWTAGVGAAGCGGVDCAPIPAVIEGERGLSRLCSPYEIPDGTRVRVDGTLRMGPGTEVVFGQGAELVVRGELRVQGGGDPIVLRARDGARWHGIVFGAEGRRLDLQDVLIRDVGGADLPRPAALDLQGPHADRVYIDPLRYAALDVPVAIVDTATVGGLVRLDPLEGAAEQVVLVRPGPASGEWRGRFALRLLGEIELTGGLILTALDGGVRRVEMPPGSVFRSGKHYVVLQEVEFTSAAPDPAPGDWLGLDLSESWEELSNVVVRYAAEPEPGAGVVRIGSVGNWTSRPLDLTVEDYVGTAFPLPLAARPDRLAGSSRLACARGEGPCLSVAPRDLTVMRGWDLRTGGAPVTVRGGALPADMTWPGEHPWRIEGTLTVWRTLELPDPGTLVELTPGSAIEVVADGVLLARGTRFQSAADPVPGAWSGLVFQPGSAGLLDAVHVSHAGAPSPVAELADLDPPGAVSVLGSVEGAVEIRSSRFEALRGPAVWTDCLSHPTLVDNAYGEDTGGVARSDPTGSPCP